MVCLLGESRSSMRQVAERALRLRDQAAGVVDDAARHDAMPSSTASTSPSAVSRPRPGCRKLLFMASVTAVIAKSRLRDRGAGHRDVEQRRRCTPPCTALDHVPELRARLEHRSRARPSCGEFAPNAQQAHERHGREGVARSTLAATWPHARCASRNCVFSTLPAADSGSASTKSHAARAFVAGQPAAAPARRVSSRSASPAHRAAAPRRRAPPRPSAHRARRSPRHRHGRMAAQSAPRPRRGRRSRRREMIMSFEAVGDEEVAVVVHAAAVAGVQPAVAQRLGRGLGLAPVALHDHRSRARGSRRPCRAARRGLPHRRCGSPRPVRRGPPTRAGRFARAAGRWFEGRLMHTAPAVSVSP